MDTTDLRFYREGVDWYEITRIKGAPYIKVGVPVTARIFAMADVYDPLTSSVLTKSLSLESN
ncbi:MAG: hypothetical protein MRK02_16590 [Candidatus Scalindua sp.]|nr:hypothetical protein [Candidatus Scalindua sp.]